MAQNEDGQALSVVEKALNGPTINYQALSNVEKALNGPALRWSSSVQRREGVEWSSIEIYHALFNVKNLY